jgi:hypothetical protein
MTYVLKHFFPGWLLRNQWVLFVLCTNFKGGPDSYLKCQSFKDFKACFAEIP